MVKTPNQPSSAPVRISYDPCIIPFFGVLSMAHTRARKVCDPHKKLSRSDWEFSKIKGTNIDPKCRALILMTTKKMDPHFVERAIWHCFGSQMTVLGEGPQTRGHCLYDVIERNSVSQTTEITAPHDRCMSAAGSCC